MAKSYLHSMWGPGEEVPWLHKCDEVSPLKEAQAVVPKLPQFGAGRKKGIFQRT
jgi:hypothetical protein